MGETVTKEEVRDLLGPKIPSQTNKVVEALDRHSLPWVEACRFVVLSSFGADGHVDVAPKGDCNGVVKVLDSKTLLVPDRKGNRRADTLFNIIETGKLGAMFLAPGRSEVLRISGDAYVTTSSELLESCEAKGVTPLLGIVIKINRLFFHCGKAVIRSQLWDASEKKKYAKLPTYAHALKDHANLPEDLSVIQEDLNTLETEHLY
jgi:PPOX class probable FMN-dependent enzyme